MKKSTDNWKKTKYYGEIQHGAPQTDSQLETEQTHYLLLHEFSMYIVVVVLVLMRRQGDEIKDWRSGGGAMTP